MRHFHAFVTLALTATLGLLLVGSGPAAGQHHGSIALSPDQFIWGAPLPNGAKVAVLEGNPEAPGPFPMRVILPANWTIPPEDSRALARATIPVLLTVASYNIHGGIGLDRRRDLDRIAGVIAELQ